MIEKNIIKVILDENAIILDFECTFSSLECYTKEEVVGKNWFEIFIEPNDNNDVKKVFLEAFTNKTTSWKTHSNDVLCKDGTHKLIDFENSITPYGDTKVIISLGREHFRNE